MRHRTLVCFLVSYINILIQYHLVQMSRKEDLLSLPFLLIFNLFSVYLTHLNFILNIETNKKKT